MIIIVAEIIRTPIKSEQFYSKTLFHFITFMKCADGFPKNSKYQVSDITTNNISLCVPKLFKFGLGLNPFIPICLCSFLSCCFFFLNLFPVHSDCLLQKPFHGCYSANESFFSSFNTVLEDTCNMSVCGVDAIMKS